jgi:hypothetical protein
LDIHFEATQGSPPALQTVIAGSALLTPVGDIETMVAASERDAPLVVVGSALPRGRCGWSPAAGNPSEILIMIAVVVAFQAELIWRRARPLGASTSSRQAAVAAQR